ncbi:MAG: hypothetical protein AAGC81_12615 [Pseudomonadota bacterium]
MIKKPLSVEDLTDADLDGITGGSRTTAKKTHSRDDRTGTETGASLTEAEKQVILDNR